MTIIGLWLGLIGALASEISQAEKHRWQRVVYFVAGYMTVIGFILVCVGMSIFLWRVMP